MWKSWPDQECPSCHRHQRGHPIKQLTFREWWWLGQAGCRCGGCLWGFRCNQRGARPGFRGRSRRDAPLAWQRRLQRDGAAAAHTFAGIEVAITDHLRRAPKLLLPPRANLPVNHKPNARYYRPFWLFRKQLVLGKTSWSWRGSRDSRWSRSAGPQGNHGRLAHIILVWPEVGKVNPWKNSRPKRHRLPPNLTRALLLHSS